MTPVPASGTFQLDPGSSVAINHKSMWGLVTIKGSFTTVEGGGEVKPDGTATGVIKVHAASIDTKHKKRDQHLRSEHFLSADAFPVIELDVTSASTAQQGQDARIAGRLTVRGVTRPVSLTAEITAADADSATLTTRFTVDRNEFGLTWNQLGMIRGLTTATATLRFTRVPA